MTSNYGLTNEQLEGLLEDALNKIEKIRMDHQEELKAIIDRQNRIQSEMSLQWGTRSSNEPEGYPPLATPEEMAMRVYKEDPETTTLWVREVGPWKQVFLTEESDLER